MATQPIDRQKIKHQMKVAPRQQHQLVKRSNKQLIHEVEKPHTSFVVLHENRRNWWY